MMAQKKLQNKVKGAEVILTIPNNGEISGVLLCDKIITTEEEAEAEAKKVETDEGKELAPGPIDQVTTNEIRIITHLNANLSGLL